MTPHQWQLMNGHLYMYKCIRCQIESFSKKFYVENDMVNLASIIIDDCDEELIKRVQDS